MQPWWSHIFDLLYNPCLGPTSPLTTFATTSPHLNLTLRLQLHFATTMKFTSCAVFLFSLLSVSLAQSIMIGFPKPGANITAGSNFTVEVDRPVCHPFLSLNSY